MFTKKENKPLIDSKDDTNVYFGGWLYIRDKNGKIVNTGFNCRKETLKDDKYIYIEHLNIR